MPNLVWYRFSLNFANAFWRSIFLFWSRTFQCRTSRCPYRPHKHFRNSRPSRSRPFPPGTFLSQHSFVPPCSVHKFPIRRNTSRNDSPWGTFALLPNNWQDNRKDSWRSESELDKDMWEQSTEFEEYLQCMTHQNSLRKTFKKVRRRAKRMMLWRGKRGQLLIGWLNVWTNWKANWLEMGQGWVADSLLAMLCNANFAGHRQHSPAKWLGVLHCTHQFFRIVLKWSTNFRLNWINTVIG